MDFFTDDNSWRSAQKAAEFSSLLQIQMADEPGVEWIERAQLDKARQELELSAMDGMNGGAALRQGKWLKADWMITGQFSLDDRNHRTLFLEITDLQHADVLASKTITFSDVATPQFQAGTSQVGAVAGALHQLLADACARQQQTAGKILVAPLFLAEVGRNPFFKGGGVLEQGFDDALERAVTTNGRVRLIHFPKAYRSTEESEMVLDGLVEADRNVWQQTADLYVWGTYTVTNKLVPGQPRESRVNINLCLWDGSSLQPTVAKEEIACPFAGEAPPDRVAAALNRLARQVVVHAHKSAAQTDTASMRKEIAGSLVQTYDQMTNPTGHHHEELGFEDPGKFLQAAHMLETAFFFDPDNAEARVLYLSCRWDFRISFKENVQNQFWSKWRRSQAWGKYVNRFGLKSVEVDLPFPYQQRGGLPAAYVDSLEEALKMFPQWDSTNEMELENKWQQEGVHTWLVEAELHGFPNDIPHELAMQWKQEAEAELVRRKKEVAGFSPSSASEPYHPQTVSSRLPGSVPNQRLPGFTGHSPLPFTNHTAGQRPIQTSRQMVPAPSWTKDTHIQNISSLFRLSPPNALPVEVKPSVKEIRFPEQFEVQSVDQMGFLGDKLLILAMDKRSAFSSDSNPDVSAERLEKHRRLWVLRPDEENPTLYEADLFPQSINTFLLNGNQLWVAGKNTGYLDLKTHQFREFGLPDGFDMQTSDALGFAGGHVFAANDRFKVSMWDAAQDRWSRLALPPANLSGGTDSPFLLVGGKQWLACVAGAILIHDFNHDTWTNLAGANGIGKILADDSGFWFGGRDGLHFYDPASQSLKHWTAPATFEGIFNSVMGFSPMGNAEMSQGNRKMLDEQIQGLISRLYFDRVKNRATNSGKNTVTDPLHLDWRVPGEVTALANDGDFLWIGVGNYSGNYLLLLHKPSRSLIAGCPIMVRGRISSLAVSGTSVWVGTAYGDQKLLQIPKSDFLSVPQNRWTSLAISSEERVRLISGMSVRDQAMYAFYAGDDARVAALLGNLDPAEASLEELFLLAFSYDASGLDKPELARAWFERIISNHPDSPWARFAQKALPQNELNHNKKMYQAELLKKYDQNHNGILDPQEQTTMEKDPDYQVKQEAWNAGQREIQLKEMMRRFDLNGDGRLDREELDRLDGRVAAYSRPPSQMWTGHNIPDFSQMTEQFSAAALVLQKFDTNGNSLLEGDELKALAQDINKSQ